MAVSAARGGADRSRWGRSAAATIAADERQHPLAAPARRRACAAASPSGCSSCAGTARPAGCCCCGRRCRRCGSRPRGFPGWHLLAVFVLGTILMRSAGCCVNDVADREFDRHVKRTAARPVTSGAVGAGEALGVGAALAFAAFLLVLTTNLAAVLWSFAALAVTLVYPYTKRFFSMPQAVLGVAFSFGIPMAFAAVRGGDAWTLASVEGAVPPLAWAMLARQRLLGARLRHRVRDGRPRRRHPHRHPHLGADARPLRRGRRDGVLRRLRRRLGGDRRLDRARARPTTPGWPSPPASPAGTGR